MVYSMVRMMFQKYLEGVAVLTQGISFHICAQMIPNSHQKHSPTQPPNLVNVHNQTQFFSSFFNFK